jgi:hypothetical protein
MRELLEALNRWPAQYLVIGAHAVGVYTEHRGTKDLEIWVNPPKANAKRVYAALNEFGAPLFGSTAKTLTNKEDFLVIGVAPNRIDIVKSIPGLEFEASWKTRRTIDIAGMTAHFLNLRDLLAAKLAAGRPQDLVDAAKLKMALELDRRLRRQSKRGSELAEPHSGQRPRSRQSPRGKRSRGRDHDPE